MSFTALAPTSPEATVANDGWFPDIDLADCRAASRLDGTVTPERLLYAVANAVASVNDELAAWKAEKVAAGHADLEAVPASKVTGQSVFVMRYLRAVYCTAHAELVERYRDLGITAAGDKRADAMEPRIEDLRRDARWAIADLQGRRRTTVELI